MCESNSPLVISSQTSPHQNLAKLVDKYQRTELQDSIPKHAYDAFDIASKFVANEPIILDSGCGTGESSYRLAEQYPDMKVLAIDKSIARLQRSHHYGETPDNLLLLRSDCVYLWRLIKQAQWNIQKHYLFYPNPWPKPGHLQRRWHCHPIFPTLVALGGSLTMRTNWQIYADEFVQALEIITSRSFSVKSLELEGAFTPFERKYLSSGHALYEVCADLKLTRI